MMKLLSLLLMCLLISVARLDARDPQGGDLVDCGSEKIAVFDGTVSPDGRYSFGWTLRPEASPTPVHWSDYDPDHVFEWLQNKLFELGAAEPYYIVVNGILDLRARRFTVVESKSPCWPHKNYCDLEVAWSHGAQPGKFAVIHDGAHYGTVDLWLAVTGAKDIHVVKLIDSVDKSVQRFLRQKAPKKYDAMVVTYGDVSYARGMARIDFDAEVPKSTDIDLIQGTVLVTLPGGTITGVHGR